MLHNVHPQFKEWSSRALAAQNSCERFIKGTISQKLRQNKCIVTIDRLYRSPYFQSRLSELSSFKPPEMITIVRAICAFLGMPWSRWMALIRTHRLLKAQRRGKLTLWFATHFVTRLVKSSMICCNDSLRPKPHEQWGKKQLHYNDTRSSYRQEMIILPPP